MRRHRKHLLEIPDVRRIGHGGAAPGPDLLDDLEGALRRRAVPAEIVDDDFCAARGEPQRVAAAEAGRRPGDDRDPSVELDGHGFPFAFAPLCPALRIAVAQAQGDPFLVIGRAGTPTPEQTSAETINET